MIQPLNRMIGLPEFTPPAELACAADRFCQSLFDKAACGDSTARRELIKCHVAYLVWAYTSRDSGDLSPVEAVVRH